MIYPTIKATVQQGKIELLEDITLPENATLLITVLDDSALEMFTLGEHLVAGLQDMLMGRIKEVNTSQELTYHLDTIFDDEN